MVVIALLGAAAISAALIRDGAAPIGRAVFASVPTAAGEPSPQDHEASWSLGHGYARRGEHILFDGVRIDRAGREDLDRFQATLGRPVALAHHVHAASFAALSEEYAKDKNTVYYKWISPGRFWVVEIPGADPATFEVMDRNLARDAARVYRTDVPIEGADAATARVVNAGWVWKDRSTVYYQFTPLAGADPASFRHLNQAFYRDARHVYWSTTRLEGADVNTFRTFGNDVPYAADARHVWFGDRRIPQVDARSFRLFHNHVFADSRGVYVGGSALPVIDADAGSFEKVAELESAECVLFRDAMRSFVFDPLYAEVYTMTPRGDHISITKPVWIAEADGSLRHVATVSATWRDGMLSDPVVAMQPAFEGAQRPSWEAGKLERMTSAIGEALDLARKDPVAATDGDDGKRRGPLVRRGHQ
ncbi:MAG TPA: DKNYY domain-containing protein [Phycisphaerales bacterium]|nr:DKNYY domain-containing protein [Phycisphaerales bacterium]HMP38506.1 DKNYY domain-containing protein [Phycisphaerales bacterium]